MKKRVAKKRPSRLKVGDVRAQLDPTMSDECVYLLLSRKNEKAWQVLVLDSTYDGEFAGDLIEENEGWLLVATEAFGSPQ